MKSVSDKTKTITSLLFAEDKRTEVLENLKEYISTDHKETNERLCFAVLKLSVRRGKGRIGAFYKAIQLAEKDYRDLLVAAGFGNSIHIHKKWAEKILNNENY